MFSSTSFLILWISAMIVLAHKLLDFILHWMILDIMEKAIDYLDLNFLCHPKSFCTVSNPFRIHSFQTVTVVIWIVGTLIPTTTVFTATCARKFMSPSWTSRSRFPGNKCYFWACCENPEWVGVIIGPFWSVFTVPMTIGALTFWWYFGPTVVPAAPIKTTTCLSVYSIDGAFCALWAISIDGS